METEMSTGIYHNNIDFETAGPIFDKLRNAQTINGKEPIKMNDLKSRFRNNSNQMFNQQNAFRQESNARVFGLKASLNSVNGVPKNQIPQLHKNY